MVTIKLLVLVFAGVWLNLSMRFRFRSWEKEYFRPVIELQIILTIFAYSVTDWTHVYHRPRTLSPVVQTVSVFENKALFTDVNVCPEFVCIKDCGEVIMKTSK